MVWNAISFLLSAALLAAAMSLPLAAETLVAARTIRSQTILAPEDLTLAPGEVPGALASPDDAIGLEARAVLYAGRPIRPEDLGPPAAVERNQPVALVYASGALTIQAEGRALQRGTVGAWIRVMNLASRTTVSGEVLPDGRVRVGRSGSGS